MTITIYVNHNDKEVLTEKQFEELVARQVADVLEDECDKEQFLYTYLEQSNVDIVDCFLMTEEVRNRHKEEFEKWLLQDIRTSLIDEYSDKYNLEV